ncbi:MAG: DUF2490 domain-containing protein [Saprospiraceae bacterium]
MTKPMYALVLLLLGSWQWQFAQEGDLRALGTWNILNVKVDVSDRWSVFVEPQLRSLRFYNHFHYYEIKGGVTYDLSKNFSLTAGFGRYDTYQEGGDFVTPKANNEIRSWVQLQMYQYLNRVRFEHRYRAEQRWTSDGYRNRFRYRFNTIFPLNRAVIEPGAFYFTVWDELFLTNQAPYFERNRFFVGGGYEFSPLFTLQMGWINQFDYEINDETGRNFVQISLLFELQWQQVKRAVRPDTMN